MNIDLGPVRAGQISYADLIRDVRPADLYTMIDELFDALESILTQATPATVLFMPRDPGASDQSEQGWTLGHVVTHLTATLEDAAATAAMLARGVEVKERLRYETPWQNMATLQMVQARLQESHRICRAFLNVWPDEPHLNVTMTLIPLFGPMNAIGFYVLGIAHGQGHLDQLREIIQQSIVSEDL